MMGCFTHRARSRSGLELGELVAMLALLLSFGSSGDGGEGGGAAKRPWSRPLSSEDRLTSSTIPLTWSRNAWILSCALNGAPGSRASDCWSMIEYVWLMVLARAR